MTSHPREHLEFEPDFSKGKKSSGSPSGRSHPGILEKKYFVDTWSSFVQILFRHWFKNWLNMTLQATTWVPSIMLPRRLPTKCSKRNSDGRLNSLVKSEIVAIPTWTKNREFKSLTIYQNLHMYAFVGYVCCIVQSINLALRVDFFCYKEKPCQYWTIKIKYKHSLTVLVWWTHMPHCTSYGYTTDINQ